VTVLAILDRSETAGISSVTDNGTGSPVWTARQGPLNADGTTARQWVYERTAGDSGTVNITVTFDTAVNSMGVAATCTSDTAALVYQSSGAEVDQTTATSWTSSAVSFGATGVSFAYLGGNNGVTTSLLSSNTVDLYTTSARVKLLRRLESSGSFDISFTTGSTTATLGISLYQENAGGSNGSLMLLGVGK
jgi:hypothetical protein